MLLITVLSTAACSAKPKDNPIDVVRRYYAYLVDGDYREMYRLEATVSLGSITEQQYVAWRGLQALNTTYALGEVTLERELTEHAIGSIKYPHAVEMHVVLNPTHLPTGLTPSQDLLVVVVAENRKWKLAFAPRNINKLMANEHYWLGIMYILGKGREVNFAEALQTFQNGIGADETNALNYLGVGHAYRALGQYVEAIEAYMTCASVCDAAAGEFDYEKAQALYSIGAIYETKLPDRDRAIEYYRASLDALPENEYALEALQRLGIK